MFKQKENNQLNCPICRDIIKLSYHSLGKSFDQEMKQKIDYAFFLDYNSNVLSSTPIMMGLSCRQYGKHFLVPINKSYYRDIFMNGYSDKPIDDVNYDEFTFSEDEDENILDFD